MNRISELRKAAKLSQSALGKILGAAQNTISQWENGTREIDVKTSYALADYFNVSVDYLLGREEQQKKPTVEDDGLSLADRIERDFLQASPEEQRDILQMLFKIFAERKDEPMKVNTPATRFKSALDAAGFSEQTFAQLCGLDPYDIRLILAGLALPGERILNILSLSVPTAKTDIAGEWSNASMYEDFSKANAKTKKRMFDVNGVPMSLYKDYLNLTGIEKAPDVINIERHDGKFHKVNPPKSDASPQA